MKNRFFHHMSGLFLAPFLLSPGLAVGDTATFDGNGTFIAPPNVTSITIQAWGGGGGGGLISGTPSYTGGGGGSFCSGTVVVTPGQSYAVTVGAGGTQGVNGGASSVAGFATLTANGGGKGGSTLATVNTVGAGGTTAACTGAGATKYAGGNGGARGISIVGTGTGGGGGGGGSATTSAVGGNGGNGATLLSGGAGGAGGAGQGTGGSGGNVALTSSVGGTGTAPGGGGGGKGASLGGGSSGAGAAGRVVITYRINQTITFDAAPTPTYVPGGAFQVTATATSSLPVTFSSQTPTVCTTSSTSSPATVTILTAGLCTIAADQAGDGNYNAAPQVTQNITIAKAATTTVITSDTPDPSLVNQEVTVNFAVTTESRPAAVGATVQAVAPGPTGNVTVTVTGPVNSNSCTDTVAVGSCTLPGTDFPQPGTYTLTATYAGDTNFNTSSGTASHQVNQAGPVGGAAIPTLQEWALILMGLLFGGLVWRQSRRTGRMEA